MRTAWRPSRRPCSRSARNEARCDSGSRRRTHLMSSFTSVSRRANTLEYRTSLLPHTSWQSSPWLLQAMFVCVRARADAPTDSFTTHTSAFTIHQAASRGGWTSRQMIGCDKPCWCSLPRKSNACPRARVHSQGCEQASKPKRAQSALRVTWSHTSGGYMQVLGGQAASKLRTRAASGRTIAMLVWAHAKLKVPSTSRACLFSFGGRLASLAQSCGNTCIQAGMCRTRLSSHLQVPLGPVLLESLNARLSAADTQLAPQVCWNHRGERTPPPRAPVAPSW